jgi:hypothetical protein
MTRPGILKNWFLIRRDLPQSRQLTLTFVSFLLPIALWCFVSYVPWIWHPDVKIELSAERDGVTTVFTAGDHVSRKFFPEFVKAVTAVLICFKYLSITHLEIYPNRNSPTDFAEEPGFLICPLTTPKLLACCAQPGRSQSEKQIWINSPPALLARGLRMAPPAMLSTRSICRVAQAREAPPPSRRGCVRFLSEPTPLAPVGCLRRSRN